MEWQKLIEILPHKKFITNDIQASFQHLATDSRLVNLPQKTLFIAIDGNRNDGHNYINDLYQNGMINFIVEKEINFLLYPKANFLWVENSIDALQKIAKYHRNQFKLNTIAITGSNGKTTIKEWLSMLFSPKYQVVKSPKSFNSQIGVPLSVWQIEPSHQLGIFEAGISLPNEMHKLENIIKPNIGIFTNIGNAHNSGFNSLEQKLEEKSKLFQNCETIICSKDQTMVFNFLKKKFTNSIISWSIKDNTADYFYQIDKNTITFEWKNTNYTLNLPFTFSIWIENALHVLTTALFFDIPIQQIQQTILQFKPIAMRLEVKEGRNDTYLIDDTYNNDLQSLEIALDFLEQQRQYEKRTIILSDILQSGLNPETLYSKVNQLLIQRKINFLIGIGSEIYENKHLFTIPFHLFKNVDDFFKENMSFFKEMILIKGARPFEFEKIVQKLETQTQQTVLKINFESIIHNLNVYKSLLSKNTKIMVMLKAFAYGGGSREIANLLQFHHIDYLGVAFVDEAIQLRNNGINTPIMIMNVTSHFFNELKKYELEAVIFNNEGLKQLEKLPLENTPDIHLKLDTGMNRLGFKDTDLEAIISFFKNNPNIKVKSIFTHLACAEDPNEDAFTLNQLHQFESMYQKICDKIDYTPIKHCLNSAGIVRWKDYHFDMVRLGIGIYGFDSVNTLPLRLVSTLVSKISQLKRLKKGETIGYGRLGKATQDTTIAIVPIGYADGYFRAFGNGKAKMNIKGILVPTIGNICMDMCMLDVSDVPCQEGDEVEIFGEKPTVIDLAKITHTIPYEILTHVNQRVKRIFILS